MKNISNPLQTIMTSVAAFFTVSLLLGQFASASNLDECLLESLKKADDTVTVGQIREQCQQNAETKGQVGSSGNGSNGPSEMILKTALSRKPAFFPHKSHQEKYDCGTCHHGKNSSGEKVGYSGEMVIGKCTTCHNADMPNKELNSFQAIGHKLCRECHRTHQDITKAKCSTCHRKGL